MQEHVSTYKVTRYDEATWTQSRYSLRVPGHRHPYMLYVLQQSVLQQGVEISWPSSGSRWDVTRLTVQVGSASERTPVLCPLAAVLNRDAVS